MKSLNLSKYLKKNKFTNKVVKSASYKICAKLEFDNLIFGAVIFEVIDGCMPSRSVGYICKCKHFFWLFATHAFTNFILGAIDGIMFFITPQWGELLNVKVWYAAVTQSFFSLSVGFGALFTYSSYNDFKHNVYRDALIISFTDTFTSVLAGKWENNLKYFF